MERIEMPPDDEPAITPKQVAEWMVEQLEEADELPQKATALRIQQGFGENFVCLDAEGELGIARKVLYQFRKLTGDAVVWVAVQGDWTAGFWRRRCERDGAGRKQYLY